VSLFDDEYVELCSPELSEQLGGDVTYVAADGTETAVVGAICEPEESSEEVRRDGRTRKKRGRLVAIPVAQVAGVALRATLVIAGVEWAVESIESTTATWHRLRLARPETMERAKQGYRP